MYVEVVSLFSLNLPLTPPPSYLQPIPPSAFSLSPVPLVPPVARIFPTCHLPLTTSYSPIFLIQHSNSEPRTQNSEPPSPSNLTPFLSLRHLLQTPRPPAPQILLLEVVLKKGFRYSRATLPDENAGRHSPTAIHDSDLLKIITVYEPDPAEWYDYARRR
jgi:hypothetical protein